ncbi:ultraviolet-B receptor UVR8 isoform X1 [Typha latifolia]|uniref:ultraviolet-B receptor UVR8 isoform X1 n=1 Tax=Typha latifolia TaxID=4733 RepID=UPI003C309FAC
MSAKIVSVAAGEAHTLALTGDGRVFSWGRGTFGRLGTEKEEDELLPVPIALGERKNGQGGRPPKFVGIAAGAYHSLALDDDGSVWSWGYNIYGQLGYGEENSLIPSTVEQLQELGYPDSLADGSSIDGGQVVLKICAVKAGGMMSFAIDNLGALWMWGNCPQQTDTGEFCLSGSLVPLPVWDFHGHTVVKVACGNEHVVAAVSAGETYIAGNLVCYAWGNNSHGQLGLGDKENRSRPAVIPVFNEDSSWVVYEIACGAFHTAVLTHEKTYEKNIESKCWTFGLGENGQLAHGTTISSCKPEPVNGLPHDAFLVSLDCGLFHTAVVSSSGEVWCWGMEKGLGLCPDASYTGTDAGDALYPLRMQSPETNGPNFTGPVQVACGAAHTVLVSGEGYRVWAWGRGRCGVLGSGHTTDSYVPCAVMWPSLDENFKEMEGNINRDVKVRDKDGNIAEMEQKLSAAMEEIEFLRTKLTRMERYANVLHISIFRKTLDERTLPKSLQDSGVFDMRKELENVMDSADNEELVRMEMFHRSMLSSVKDKQMKRKIQEMVKECLLSLSSGRQAW